LKYFQEIIAPFYDDFPHEPEKIKTHHMLSNIKSGDKFTITALYPSIRLNPESFNCICYNPGANDHLDQYICLLGLNAQYDTFIFQHEIGHFRAITEILDLRVNPHQHLHEIPLTDRQDCLFQRFINPKPRIDRNIFKHVYDPLLTTIWFPVDGLLTGQDGHIKLVNNIPSGIIYS